MNILNEVIALIGSYLIRGIFISVLVVILSSKLFKKRFDTEYAIQIIRWTIVSYSVLTLVFFLMLFILPANSADAHSLKARAIGPYGYALVLMTVGAILPLILLFKKNGANVYFVFAMAISANLGWLMESLVIHTMIIHRDYPREISRFKVILPSDMELIIFLKGLIFGVIVLLIGNLIFSRKKQLADDH